MRKFMTDTDTYWMPDCELSDDDLTDCTESSRDYVSMPRASSCAAANSSVRGRTWLILLTSTAFTVATTVLVKITVGHFDYLIACSLGLWLGWKI